MQTSNNNKNKYGKLGLTHFRDGPARGQSFPSRVANSVAVKIGDQAIN